MIAAIKKRQTVLFASIISALVLVIGLLIFLIAAPSKSPDKKPEGVKKVPYVTGTSRIKDQDIWVHKMTSEAEVSNKRIEVLEDNLEKMIKMMQGGSEEASQPEKPLQQPLSPDQPLQVPDQTSSKPILPLPHGDVSHPPFVMPTEGGNSVGETKPYMPSHTPSSRSSTLQKISITLKNPKNSLGMKTVDNTIPAGAFAKAVLLGGVDASTSIQASNDPRPVLLKLTDVGTLPRKFHSDLKGCHALGASYGDISSERVFMRLEKLTCVERQTGEVVELNVQGYVAGEDGRAGVRGVVVDRAGENMRNAMMGGFLSGMGQFMAQSNSPVTFSPSTGLAQTDPFHTMDAMKHGAAKGVSSALERYADFYIKRAEQLQPVLQIAAGREVDIVFTQGVAMDGSTFRNKLSHINDQKRTQTIHNLEEQQSSEPATERKPL